jgi:hypothetical protein
MVAEEPIVDPSISIQKTTVANVIALTIFPTNGYVEFRTLPDRWRALSGRTRLTWRREDRILKTTRQRLWPTGETPSGLRAAEAEKSASTDCLRHGWVDPCEVEFIRLTVRREGGSNLLRCDG